MPITDAAKLALNDTYILQDIFNLILKLLYVECNIYNYYKMYLCITPFNYNRLSQKCHTVGLL